MFRKPGWSILVSLSDPVVCTLLVGQGVGPQGKGAAMAKGDLDMSLWVETF